MTESLRLEYVIISKESVNNAFTSLEFKEISAPTLASSFLQEKKG
jgi:hypothetical protein